MHRRANRYRHQRHYKEQTRVNNEYDEDWDDDIHYAAAPRTGETLEKLDSKLVRDTAARVLRYVLFVDPLMQSYQVRREVLRSSTYAPGRITSGPKQNLPRLLRRGL